MMNSPLLEEGMNGDRGVKRTSVSPVSMAHRSILARIGDVFSVHDHRLYDESSLSYQLYLLWALELLFAIIFVQAGVECSPTNLLMRGFGEGEEVHPVELSGDPLVCAGRVHYSGSTVEDAVCGEFHREYVGINCESEVKSRGTVLLLATLLYLVILGALLARSNTFVVGINKRVSRIVQDVDEMSSPSSSAASAAASWTPLSSSTCHRRRDGFAPGNRAALVDPGDGSVNDGGGGAGGGSASRAAESLREKEEEVLAVIRRFRRYKWGYIAYFLLSASALTAWLFGIGLHRTKPAICGYHSDVWQPFEPYPAYLCAMTTSTLVRLSLGSVLIFRTLVLIRLVFSVRSLDAFAKMRRWRERSARKGIPEPLSRFLESGAQKVKEVTAAFPASSVGQIAGSFGTSASQFSNLGMSVAQGCAAAAEEIAREMGVDLCESGGGGTGEKGGNTGANPLDVLAALASQGKNSKIDEDFVRKAVEIGVRKALESSSAASAPSKPI